MIFNQAAGDGSPAPLLPCDFEYCWTCGFGIWKNDSNVWDVIFGCPDLICRFTWLFPGVRTTLHPQCLFHYLTTRSGFHQACACISIPASEWEWNEHVPQFWPCAISDLAAWPFVNLMPAQPYRDVFLLHLPPAFSAKSQLQIFTLKQKSQRYCNTSAAKLTSS